MSARRIVLALGAALCWTVAHAQQHPHEVVPGDTLIGIAKRYWNDAGYWRAIRAANPDIRNERRLRPGSTLRVPMPPAGSGAVAVHVSGTATLTRFGRLLPLARDADVLDTDVVDVAAGSYVTLRWPDGVITHLLSGTRLRIVPPPAVDTARRLRILELQGGNVESSVPKAQEGRDYRIRTRVGTAAVRGTQFGVRLPSPDAMVTDVREGTVVLAGDGFQPLDLPAGTGARADLSRRQPTAVVMLPPPGLDDPLVLTPDSPLQGEPVADAAAYEFEVGTPALPSAILSRATAASPAFALPPLADGAYRVALRAIDAAGIPGRPAVRTLSVISLPSPFLSEPGNDGVLAQDQPARLLCAEVPNATGYVFEIRSLDAAGEPRRLEAAGACQVALPALHVGAYTWRALATRAIAGGRVLRSSWSAPARFSVVARPPVPLPSVTGGQSQRLMWEGTAGATYVVQVARDIAFTSLVAEQRVDTAQATLGVPTGEAYYVRIRTLAASGVASDFSPPRIVRGPAWLGTSDGAPVSDSAGTPLAPAR